jgi:hypothetical protein
MIPFKTKANAVVAMDQPQNHTALIQLTNGLLGLMGPLILIFSFCFV